MHFEFGYFSKDVAIELEITTSTLRRWSIELEKQGYVFTRNEKGQRVYYERDFKAFRELKKLLAKSISFENATKLVASMDLNGENAIQTPSVYKEMMRLSSSELQTIIKSALEEEREIILKAIDEKLNNQIELRDRQLINHFRQTIDQKQIEFNSEKKGFWARLFPK